MDLQAVEAVSAPLKEGFVSICNICKSLLDAQVDPNTDMCSNYEQIREHIKRAEQCLKESEKRIKEKLKCLDESMEQLTERKGTLEQQNKEKRKAMDKLHIEKKSAEESLKNSKAALEQAEKINVIAGAIVSPIPVFGWIAGAIMLVKGGCAIADASKAIRDAEDELKKNESQVNDNNKKVSDYQHMISTIQNEIKKTDVALYKIQKEIAEVKQHLEDTSNIQEMVRTAVNFLCVLGGRVTVLERQTQRFILRRPVIKCMEDVISAAGNVAENRILCVPDFINALRENVGGLLALENSPQNSDYDSYY